MKLKCFNLLNNNKNILNNNLPYINFKYTDNTFIDFLKKNIINIYNNKLLSDKSIDKNIDNQDLSIYNQNNIDNHIMIFSEYLLYNNNSLSIENIIKNKYYFICVNSNKVLKIFVNNIDNNIITINNNKNIIFDNYKWYYYHPNIIINKEYVILNTFINYNFINLIL